MSADLGNGRLPTCKSWPFLAVSKGMPRPDEHQMQALKIKSRLSLIVGLFSFAVLFVVVPGAWNSKQTNARFETTDNDRVLPFEQLRIIAGAVDEVWQLLHIGKAFVSKGNAACLAPTLGLCPSRAAGFDGRTTQIFKNQNSRRLP